jgi:hypothetical protein
LREDGILREQGIHEPNDDQREYARLMEQLNTIRLHLRAYHDQEERHRTEASEIIRRLQEDYDTVLAQLHARFPRG